MGLQTCCLALSLSLPLSLSPSLGVRLALFRFLSYRYNLYSFHIDCSAKLGPRWNCPSAAVYTIRTMGAVEKLKVTISTTTT